MTGYIDSFCLLTKILLVKLRPLSEPIVMIAVTKWIFVQVVLVGFVSRVIGIHIGDDCFDLVIDVAIDLSGIQ